MLCRTLAPPCRACRPAQRPVFRPSPRSRRSMVVAARITVEPFNGCNCYYLLSKSKRGDKDGRALVLETLKQIQAAKLNVVRTWAFQDDDKGGQDRTNAMQYLDGKTIVRNPDMLDGLKWLLEQAHNHDLKLMLTLINGYPTAYGGMRQYVRWSRKIHDMTYPDQPKRDIPEPKKTEGMEHYQFMETLNNEFYTDTHAQKLFTDYLNFLIPAIKNMDHFSVVHSWDIANEPRCRGDTSGKTLTNWINATAAFVKSLDPSRPVTCGLDGFFGAELDTLNPYSQVKPEVCEGGDFVANCKSPKFGGPNLDFASIHLYPLNWNKFGSSDEKQRDPGWATKSASWATEWIQSHIDVIKNSDELDNIPLVLQEFNLANWANWPNKQPKKYANLAERTQMFEKISTKLVEEVSNKGVFVGSMVWCLADPTCAKDDSEQYYLYEPSALDKALEKDPGLSALIDKDLNNAQMAVLKKCSEQVNNKPRPS